MPEHFLVRLKGGPHPATYIPAEGQPVWGHLEDPAVRWPLPDAIPAGGGEYVKVSESKLEPQPDDSHVLRGAEYEWREAGHA